MEDRWGENSGGNLVFRESLQLFICPQASWSSWEKQAPPSCLFLFCGCKELNSTEDSAFVCVCVCNSGWGNPLLCLLEKYFLKSPYKCFYIKISSTLWKSFALVDKVLFTVNVIRLLVFTAPTSLLIRRRPWVWKHEPHIIWSSSWTCGWSVVSPPTHQGLPKPEAPPWDLSNAPEC